MSCTCESPVESINPRHGGHCVKCSKIIAEPDWESNDRNLGLFFERLAEAMFPAYSRTLDRQHIPHWFFAFYRHCSHREKAGRKKFGAAYLTYSNEEGKEENADAANYAFFRLCKDRREGKGDHEIDRLLFRAKCAALGWKDAFEEDQHVSHPFSEGEKN